MKMNVLYPAFKIHPVVNSWATIDKKLLNFWHAICIWVIKLWVFNKKARKTGVNLAKESIVKKIYTKIGVTITPRKKFNLKSVDLMARFTFTLLIFFILSIKSFACDPNQDCMSSVNYPCPTWKYPGRTCQKKTEDTLCAAARKICQKDCSNINSDASGYIARDYERIQQIDSAIAQNNSQLVYNSTLTENNDKFIANQTALCADIQKSHDEYLQNVTIQRAFVVSLDEISNSSNSSDLSAQIDNSPKFSQIEKTILKNFIKATKASTIDLQTLIGQYKKEMFEDFEKVLSTALDASMADCETQKYQISTQTQILSNQKDEINAENNVLSAERQSKISDILSQEARKCTPW